LVEQALKSVSALSYETALRVRLSALRDALKRQPWCASPQLAALSFNGHRAGNRQILLQFAHRWLYDRKQIIPRERELRAQYASARSGGRHLESTAEDLGLRRSQATPFATCPRHPRIGARLPRPPTSPPFGARPGCYPSPLRSRKGSSHERSDAKRAGSRRFQPAR
jgi:hypothetical protein